MTTQENDTSECIGDDRATDDDVKRVIEDSPDEHSSVKAEHCEEATNERSMSPLHDNKENAIKSGDEDLTDNANEGRIAHEREEDCVDTIPPYDEVTLNALTLGCLSHFLPDVQKAKSILHELTENQRTLLLSITQENKRCQDCDSMTELTVIMAKCKQYHSKLINIKKDMLMLIEKSIKLKKRSIRLQQQKQKDALQREHQREKELERERQLIAKPAKKHASAIM
ncbi:unnamed protein product [Owenia fusiformis]|uniref:BLOC-1 subunit 6 n=1 Tax=Owenia fusiformis TaxID=6347 RepID=A0A8S4N366_OWEFU|nr:unnamed protein product [Owenia fusiformis]